MKQLSDGSVGIVAAATQAVGAASEVQKGAEMATELVRAALVDHPRERRLTLVAVSVSNLVPQPALQLELPLGEPGKALRPGSSVGAARWAVDRSVDQIRARYGRAAVGYAAVRLADGSGVPDAFRQLAEHDPGDPPTDPH